MKLSASHDDEAVDFADFFIASLMNGATTSVAISAAFAALFRKGKWIPRASRKRLRSREWVVVRARILQRDGFVCSYCPSDATEVDHVVPLARGGSNADGNLVAACGYCNRSKGAKTLSEWRGQQ